MSVNSAAVLRLTGRGGGTVVGAPRGRSSSRGRGELPLGCAAVDPGDPGQSCSELLSGAWLEPGLLMPGFFLLKALKPFHQGDAGECRLCLVMTLHILPQLVSLSCAFDRLVGGKAKGKGSLGVEYEIPWFRIVRNK